MKRTMISMILCIVTVIMIFPMKAKADVGPKPSITVTFENMGDELCYGTLLSVSNETSHYNTVWDGETIPYEEGSMDYKIWKAFVDYEDADGYYFLQKFWLCSETKTINWEADSPSSFKILLYYPDKNVFVTSEIYQYYAFRSYYTVDMSGVEIGLSNETPCLIVAKESYDYTNEIIALIFRIVLTILIELGIAFLFGFSGKRVIAAITIVNIITQVILNLLLNIEIYKYGGGWIILNYVCYEFIVFLIEAVVYSLLLNRLSDKKIPVWKSILYALTANITSFIGGALLLAYCKQLLSVFESHHYAYELIVLICRIVITILIELVIAYLFGFREKKVIGAVAIVNSITQIILNVRLQLSMNRYSWGELWWIRLYYHYIRHVFVMFMIEVVIYCIIMSRISNKKIPMWKSVLYALAANAASLTACALMVYFIPGTNV